MRRSVAVLALLLAAACGGGGSTNALAPATSSPTAAPSATAPQRVPTATPIPVPSFATPEAAMQYLVAAWNRGDVLALKHVTDPRARQALNDMHYQAADLRLDRCVKNPDRGDYECYFFHGFPSGYPHRHPVGTAEFTVAPAIRSGWYMTVLVGCGDSGP